MTMPDQGTQMNAMKSLDLRSFLIGGLFTMLIVAFMLVTTTSRTPRAWEYKTSMNMNDQELNKLGEQGWEVVGYTYAKDPTGRGHHHSYYVLKRPRRSDWHWKFWK